MVTTQRMSATMETDDNTHVVRHEVEERSNAHTDIGKVIGK